MSAISVTLALPLSVSQEEAKMLFAVKLYEVGRVSLGQAAAVAGFSKRAFMEVLGRYKIPVFDYPAEELQEELEG